MASLIPDAVGDTLSQLVDYYGQIQAVKMKTKLAEAQLSLAAVDMPNKQQDPQAKAGAYSVEMGTGSQGVLIGAALVGLVALYLILKD